MHEPHSNHEPRACPAPPDVTAAFDENRESPPKPDGVSDDVWELVNRPLIPDADDLLNDAAAETAAATIWLSDVGDSEPKFLFYPYIVRGKITIIQGDPGTGKTALACKLAAEVSRGGAILDSPCQKQGKTLLLSTEDDAEVLRGRVRACGGDPAKVAVLKSSSALRVDSPELAESIREHGYSMVVFDPFQQYFEGDMHRANETHRALSRLSDLAAAYDFAAVLICHMSKASAGSKAIYRTLGSLDIVGSCRSALQVTTDPTEPDRKLVSHIKHNTSPKGRSFTYRIGEGAAVSWDGYTDDSIEEIEKKAEKTEPRPPYREDDLVISLTALLAENPEGVFVSYEDLLNYGFKLRHRECAESPRALAREIQRLKPQLLRNDSVLAEIKRARPKPYYALMALETPEARGVVRGVSLRYMETTPGGQLALPLKEKPAWRG